MFFPIEFSTCFSLWKSLNSGLFSGVPVDSMFPGRIPRNLISDNAFESNLSSIVRSSVQKDRFSHLVCYVKAYFGVFLQLLYLNDQWVNGFQSSVAWYLLHEMRLAIPPKSGELYKNFVFLPFALTQSKPFVILLLYQVLRNVVLNLQVCQQVWRKTVELKRENLLCRAEVPNYSYSILY